MKARALKISLMIGLGAFISMNIFAQPAGFQEHGNNSSGVTVASENIDSITVGTSIRYVVEPDATANPAYTFATMSGTLASSFAWTVTSVGTINGAPDTDNDMTITAAAAPATGTVSVVETSSAGCGSGTTTIINVEVIDDPTAQFTSTSDAVCNADNLAVDYTFPVTLATAVQGGEIRIHINVDGPATADIYDADLDTDDAAANFNLAAGTFNDGFGAYTVNITVVSDRISRKSGLATGAITDGAFTLTINRTPTTGPIFHLPNM